MDQQALARSISPQTSVPAYFHLTSELQQPEALEHADILLGDSAEAATALDLFLGTQGWRRFAEAADKEPATATAGSIPRARDLAVPSIIKLDNLEQVEQGYTSYVSRAAADLSAALSRRFIGPIAR